MWGSSKPKAREYSGFMGDTSPEQGKVLAEFKAWIEIENLNPINRWDDYDWLRFCRARKFVIADVQLMFTNHLNWRKKENIDDLHIDWVYAEREKVEEIYPRTYHGLDKLGRPLYIERIGTLDIPKLWTVTTEERMLREFAASFEELFYWRYPACTIAAGRRIDTSMTVMDMTNGSMGSVNK